MPLMQRICTLWSMLLPFTLVVVGSTSATADHEEVYRLRKEGKILPLSEFIKRVQTIHSAELLDAVLELKQGRYVYEIEIARNDGRFYALYFDATTGEVLQDGEK